MAKTRYVKGKDGKFAGSVGKGKTGVPTVKPASPSSLPFIVSNPDVPETPISQERLMMVALTPNPRLLDKLADDPDPRIRSTVAGNKHTPPEVLERLAKDKIEFVRAGVARNVECPDRLLERFATTEKNWAFRKAVAENLKCPEHVLGILAGDDDRDVLQTVGRHPNCPERVLREWATHHDLAWGPSRNPNSPGDVLDDLSYDKSFNWEVAENPGTPVRTLERLAVHEDEFLRRQVAHNKKCPPHLLDRLADDVEPTVRQAALANPGCGKR